MGVWGQRIRLAEVKSLSFLDNSNKDDILKKMLSDQVEEVKEAARGALCKKEVTYDII